MPDGVKVILLCYKKCIGILRLMRLSHEVSDLKTVLLGQTAKVEDNRTKALKSPGQTKNIEFSFSFLLLLLLLQEKSQNSRQNFASKQPAIASMVSLLPDISAASGESPTNSAQSNATVWMFMNSRLECEDWSEKCSRRKLDLDVKSNFGPLTHFQSRFIGFSPECASTLLEIKDASRSSSTKGYPRCSH